MTQTARHLVLVLGDQLDPRSAVFDGFDPSADVVWMAEVAGEATHVPSHKARIALFLAAMRHFRDGLRADGVPVRYTALDDADNTGSLCGELGQAVRDMRPERLVVARPGEWRVLHGLRSAAGDLGVPLEMRPDRHFVSTLEQFEEFAEGRKSLVMEHFYRAIRRRMGVLMDGDDPAGDKWNLDKQNRENFGAAGPPEHSEPMSFTPDETTRAVLDLVEERFPEHPGSLAGFDWPVTPGQARRALSHFVKRQLPGFGPSQDAMWSGEPYLFHSRLSAAMNLKFLGPMEAVRAAEAAYRQGEAPLNSVEGFVRQIIGWREYVRGIYWRFMPDYARGNALAADADLPGFYWTGETDMHCLACCIGQTLEHAYAHHIQRLMVTGLFALLLGVEPRQVHEWYLAIYADAVEWVEMPNVLGMSQYADDGIMATKPYAATGQYINRMSNYCVDCSYKPSERVSERACPFTTLYWDFLARHRQRLSSNNRMVLQLRNLDRLDDETSAGIRQRADALRAELAGY